MMYLRVSFLLLSAVFFHFTFFVSSLDEDERMEEYAARNYTWPPIMNPNTPGWSKLMMRRFRQLEFIEDLNERYNGYLVAVGSAYVAPNFTENGWGLTRAPQDLVDELKKALKEGMERKPFEEGNVDVIEIGSKDTSTLLVSIPSLSGKTLSVLKPLHEAWSGIPLIGSIAYGLRIYRNESQLNMHTDKTNTHIISCILHVDHDDDPESEPWPIIIEDFQGNTNEVVLESGDMLFYESSKCLHGRPKKFKGKWYSSIFVHYYPAENWKLNERELESHYGVPEHWADDIPEDEEDVEPLEMVGTSMKEPTCEDNWCALQNSVKWFGPAKYGEVLTTGGITFPLHIVPTETQHQSSGDEL